MITLYVLSSSLSCRKAVDYLTEMGIPFAIQHMKTHRMTYQQLKEVLYYTDEGIDDILAKGNAWKTLGEQGVDFNEITLSEFHHYTELHPSLLKVPIAIGNDRMTIGFEEGRYDIFRPRSYRTSIYNQYLEQLRADEDIRLANNEKISAGLR